MAYCKLRLFGLPEAAVPPRRGYHFERMVRIAEAKGDPTPGAICLEGGAFRGVYTSGVLDVLMENGILMADTYGVSAGALNGVNYAAGRIGESAVTNLNYRRDSRYVGVRAIAHEHGIIGFEFLFTGIVPQYEIRPGSNEPTEGRRFYAVAADCDTGEAAALSRDNCSDMDLAVQASASMPLASRVVSLDGHHYLDGGCANNIPFRFALDAGHEKIVVVLTRDRTFHRPPKTKSAKAVDKAQKTLYRRFPLLLDTLEKSDDRYEKEREEAFRLADEGRIFLIEPSEPVAVSRLERDLDHLMALYEMGRRDAERRLPALRAYLASGEAAAR